jgi:hypothetical protein
VYENRMMSRIFGSRSEEIVRGCRQLCNEKHCGFVLYRTLLRGLNPEK